MSYKQNYKFPDNYLTYIVYYCSPTHARPTTGKKGRGQGGEGNNIQCSIRFNTFS